jgi:hypothetical protein
MGKTWSKEEMDTMTRLELTLRGHQTIVRQMTEHLPPMKHITDKRKEKTYRAVINALTKADNQPAALELQTEFETHTRTHTNILPDDMLSLNILSAENRGPDEDGQQHPPTLVGAELRVSSDDHTAPSTVGMEATRTSSNEKDWQTDVICQALTR